MLAADDMEVAGVRASKREKEAVRLYVEGQAHEEIVHVEKVVSELVGPVRHDIWDVHCQEGRFWVVTSPMNLYDQKDFKSRDVVLTFHIGLSLRPSYLQERQVPVVPQAAELLPGSWRRWEQAWETFESGDEAEDFQAVGVRLRECLVSFIFEVKDEDLVPAGSSAPKDADVRGWTELLANWLASGDSAGQVALLPEEDRSRDLGLRQLADARQERGAHGRRDRAQDRGAPARDFHRRPPPARPRQHPLRRLRLLPDHRGQCTRCDWLDPDYQPPAHVPLSEEERARRLSTPCTPTSDIDTLVSPHDYLEPGAR